jgi:DNA end-binding protein Ku
MMHSIWSGAISFVLVNIPVHLYTASEEKALSFNYLNKKTLNPIRYVRVDASTGAEVSYKDIVRGYEVERGEYVVINDDDFKHASVKKTQSIEILGFYEEKDIDIKLVEKPYYLEPAEGAKRAYALLRETLAKTGKVAVGRYVLKTREHLCVLKPEKDVIVLVEMRFASELRSPAQLDLPRGEHVEEKELELAVRLVNEMSKPFKIDQFKDAYAEELKALIKDKAQGKEYHVKLEEMAVTKVSDLIAKLKESLDHTAEGTKGATKTLVGAAARSGSHVHAGTHKRQ